MKRGTQTYYYHFNVHGDVTDITDSQGAVPPGAPVNSYKYDPWGNIIYSHEEVENPFKYAGAHGYYHDPSTGLYYLRARYYGPDIYRFLTKDPDPGVLENPKSLNPYVYCGDNPVNMVDPDGCMSTSSLAYRLGSSGTLVLADGPLPIGDIIAGGILIYTGGELLYERYNTYFSRDNSGKKCKKNQNKPQDSPEDIARGKDIAREGNNILGRKHTPEKAKKWHEWAKEKLKTKRDRDLYGRYGGVRPRGHN